jgi:23S rRNA (adenine2503-C2)-methyltransferase
MSSQNTKGTSKTDILNLSHQKLTEWLLENGMERYRADQIFKWLYLRQADSFEDMTDLGKAIRRHLSSHFIIPRLKIKLTQTSKDGTQKYLFQLHDKNHIESVLIPERDHHTLCISSQVGCAQGCTFCLTARGGFKRNLTQGEIVSQVRDILKETESQIRLSNIVLMGMGEPLANYQSVVNAIDVITDSDKGLKFAGRKVTLSTAGMVPKIAELGSKTHVNLAVSLNAVNDHTRNQLMPINQKFPIKQLLDVCRQHRPRPGRMITFEYILIKGINDSPNEAKELVKLLRPIKAKINLIPFNEFEGCDFRRPAASDILRFQEILIRSNYTVMIRQSKGQDISAACGQLSASTS